MEVFKKYLDSLPKISYDILGRELKEGDRIYEIIGNSGDFGAMDIIKIAVGRLGVLSFFYEDRDKNKIVEVPSGLERLLNYMGPISDEQLRVVNKLGSPFLIPDKNKRKLAIQRGERTIRYKLVKRDGREFEILT